MDSPFSTITILTGQINQMDLQLRAGMLIKIWSFYAGINFIDAY
jgi:hypothetical protein